VGAVIVVVVRGLETVMVKDAPRGMLVEPGVDDVTDGARVGVEPELAVIGVEEFDEAVLDAKEVVTAVYVGLIGSVT